MSVQLVLEVAVLFLSMSTDCTSGSARIIFPFTTAMLARRNGSALDSQPSKFTLRAHSGTWMCNPR